MFHGNFLLVATCEAFAINPITRSTSDTPHSDSTGHKPSPQVSAVVAIFGPPIRARLNKLCSNPKRAPCSSFATAPVVRVVSPVASTCEDNACKIAMETICIRTLSPFPIAIETTAAMVHPIAARPNNPTWVIREDPNKLVRGAIPTAPNAATAIILPDMLIPNWDGTRLSCSVITKGMAVECIEATTPPNTFTNRSGHRPDELLIQPSAECHR